jgi:hypothetical protein
MHEEQSAGHAPDKHPRNDTRSYKQGDIQWCGKDHGNVYRGDSNRQHTTEVGDPVAAAPSAMYSCRGNAQSACNTMNIRIWWDNGPKWRSTSLKRRGPAERGQRRVCRIHRRRQQLPCQLLESKNSFSVFQTLPSIWTYSPDKMDFSQTEPLHFILKRCTSCSMDISSPVSRTRESFDAVIIKPHRQRTHTLLITSFIIERPAFISTCNPYYTRSPYQHASTVGSRKM